MKPRFIILLFLPKKKYWKYLLSFRCLLCASDLAHIWQDTVEFFETQPKPLKSTKYNIDHLPNLPVDEKVAGSATTAISAIPASPVHADALVVPETTLELPVGTSIVGPDLSIAVNPDGELDMVQNGRRQLYRSCRVTLLIEQVGNAIANTIPNAIGNAIPNATGGLANATSASAPTRAILDIENTDSISMALHYHGLGLRPLVLNFIGQRRQSRRRSQTRRASQEECLFRCTNAHLTHPKHMYPLRPNEVVYSPEISIFKDSKYMRLSTSMGPSKLPKVAMLACAAIRGPELDPQGQYVRSKDLTRMRDTIDAMFRLCAFARPR